MVLRDHQGRFMAGVCHFVSCHSQLAIKMGPSMVLYKTDNQGIARSLTKEEINRSAYGPLIEEVKELLGSSERGSCYNGHGYLLRARMLV